MESNGEGKYRDFLTHTQKFTIKFSKACEVHQNAFGKRSQLWRKSFILRENLSQKVRRKKGVEIAVIKYVLFPRLFINHVLRFALNKIPNNVGILWGGVDIA